MLWKTHSPPSPAIRNGNMLSVATRIFFEVQTFLQINIYWAITRFLIPRTVWERFGLGVEVGRCHSKYTKFLFLVLSITDPKPIGKWFFKHTWGVLWVRVISGMDGVSFDDGPDQQIGWSWAVPFSFRNPLLSRWRGAEFHNLPGTDGLLCGQSWPNWDSILPSAATPNSQFSFVFI